MDKEPRSRSGSESNEEELRHENKRLRDQNRELIQRVRELYKKLERQIEIAKQMDEIAMKQEERIKALERGSKIPELQEHQPAEERKAPEQQQKRKETEEMEIEALQTKRRNEDSESDTGDEEEWTEATSRKRRKRATKQQEAVTSDEEDPTPQARKRTPPTHKETGPNKQQPPQQGATDITLKNKEKWTEVSKFLTHRSKAKWTKAKLTGDGIKIMPTTREDFDKITRTFQEQGLEYHTGTLPENQSLHVVIKGLPETASPKDVSQDLEDQGFKILRVTKMTSKRTQRTLPMMMVEVPKKEEAIFTLRTCTGLQVVVESHKKRNEITQCYNCQGFHHGQRNCHAKSKCVKCERQHSTRECTRRQQDPATCTNCGGSHPASYRGCPRFPTPPPRRPTTSTQPESRRPPQPQPRTRTPPTPTPRRRISYATAAGPRRQQQPSQQPQQQQPTGRYSTDQIVEILASLLDQFRGHPRLNRF